MKAARVRETQDYITEAAIQASACNLIDPGSLLVVVRSGILQHTIPVAINDVPVTLNQDMRALVPEQGICSDYLGYLVRGLQDYFRDDWVKQGATVESIEHRFMADTPIPIPPTNEQHVISAYLDRETVRIDRLHAAKRELLISLADLKTARISELVTGAKLPATETGDPWIPTIPDGWTVQRLKHLGQIRSGIAKGKEYASDEMTVTLPYMRVANVQDGHIDLSDVATIEVAEDEVGRFTLTAGDVLMNEGGDYDKLGRGAVWEGEIPLCLHQNHVFAVRLDDIAWAPWVAAVTRTAYAKFYFMNNAKQSTNLASISQKNIKELPVVIPPIRDRDTILHILENELEEIDALAEHVQHELKLLRQLESSTIRDAVLGHLHPCREATVVGNPVKVAA